VVPGLSVCQSIGVHRKAIDREAQVDLGKAEKKVSTMFGEFLLILLANVMK
jgi:hypothetical protein